METLLQTVQRHTEAHSQADGVAASAIPGLTTVRATMPSPLLHAIPRPLLCLVLQGSKHVTVDQQGTLYAPGDSLLITADVPTISQITCASRATPYLALVLELDAAVFAALADEGAAPGTLATDAELADAALRLMRFQDASASSAAFAVGYESVPQFTRDYSKLFGAPPVRDLRAARAHDNLQPV